MRTLCHALANTQGHSPRVVFLGVSKFHVGSQYQGLREKPVYECLCKDHIAGVISRVMERTEYRRNN